MKDGRIQFCADLQAIEEVGGRWEREVQLSHLALLEESVQVGILMGNRQRDRDLRISE